MPGLCGGSYKRAEIISIVRVQSRISNKRRRYAGENKKASRIDTHGSRQQRSMQTQSATKKEISHGAHGVHWSLQRGSLSKDRKTFQVPLPPLGPPSSGGREFDLKSPRERRPPRSSRTDHGSQNFFAAAMNVWKLATGHDVGVLSLTSQCKRLAQRSLSRSAVTIQFKQRTQVST